MANQQIGIPEKVRGVTAEKGYTQERTAELLGISRTQLVQRMQGRTEFKGSELLKLAFALRVPVERLFPTEAEMLAQSDLAVAS